MIGDTKGDDLPHLVVVDVTKQIADHLLVLAVVREAWRVELIALESQGIDAEVPTESWEKRIGSPTPYLRLVYPTDEQGRRRKVYVGCDPAKIAAARERIARRKRWREVGNLMEGLDRVLERVEGQLGCSERELAACVRAWGRITPPAELSMSPTGEEVA